MSEVTNPLKFEQAKLDYAPAIPAEGGGYVLIEKLVSMSGCAERGYHVEYDEFYYDRSTSWKLKFNTPDAAKVAFAAFKASWPTGAKSVWDIESLTRFRSDMQWHTIFKRDTGALFGEAYIYDDRTMAA